LASILAATSVVLTPVLHRIDPHHAAPPALTAVELVLVAVASWTLWHAGRRHLHERWRTARFAAEILRGIRASVGLLDPLDPLVLQHAPEWRRFALAASLEAWRRRDPAAALPDLRAAYLRERIVDQRDRYFNKQQPTAARRAQVLAIVGRRASFAAPFFILAALAVKYYAPDQADESWFWALVAGWFPVVLPLVAGAATSLNLARDSARRAERYRLMYSRLELVSRGFDTLATESTVRRSVAITEEILLSELMEWYVAAMNMGH
jgi:hypothetical protein